MFTASNKTMQ